MVKKNAHTIGVLLLALAAWPLGDSWAVTRCYPSQRFNVLGSNQVQDMVTNLVWQQAHSPSTMDWQAAQGYCKADFRLPTVKELESILDLTSTAGAKIDASAFPSTTPGAFWTSSPYPSAGFYWNVDFETGKSDGQNRTTPNRVRCVR